MSSKRHQRRVQERKVIHAQEHQCGHKRKFGIRAHARFAAEAYELEFRETMAVYRCRFCGCFHIGHRRA